MNNSTQLTLQNLEIELANCESRMISLTQATGNYRNQIATLATATLNESVANQTRRIAELTVMSNLLIAESTNMSTLRAEINQYKTDIRELRRPAPIQQVPRMPTLAKFDPTHEDVDDFFERFLDIMKLHEVPLSKYFEVLTTAVSPDDSRWLKAKCNVTTMAAIPDLETFGTLCISVFKDKQINGRSKERAMDTYQTAKQGTRSTAEYCIWFMKKVNLAGTPETSREVINTFKKSLHIDIKSELLRYYVTAAEATTLQEIMDMAVRLDKREQFDEDRLVDLRTTHHTPVNRFTSASGRPKDRSPRYREQGQPVPDNTCRICLRRNPQSKQLWSAEHMESHRKEQDGQASRPSSRPLLLNNINTEMEDDIMLQSEEEARDAEQSSFEVNEYTTKKSTE